MATIKNVGTRLANVVASLRSIRLTAPAVLETSRVRHPRGVALLRELHLVGDTCLQQTYLAAMLIGYEWSENALPSGENKTLGEGAWPDKEATVGLRHQEVPPKVEEGLGLVEVGLALAAIVTTLAVALLVVNIPYTFKLLVGIPSLVVAFLTSYSALWMLARYCVQMQIIPRVGSSLGASIGCRARVSGDDEHPGSAPRRGCEESQVACFGR